MEPSEFVYSAYLNSFTSAWYTHIHIGPAWLDTIYTITSTITNIPAAQKDSDQMLHLKKEYT